MGGMSVGDDDIGSAPERNEDGEEGPSRKLNWRESIIKGTTLQEVDLHTGRNGWGAPPADLFQVRGANYLSKRAKAPSAAEPLLKPLGVDWLKSSTKLEHVLAHPSNIVNKALEDARAHGEGLKAFILAINLMVPGKDHHSAVLYFMTEEPIQQESLLHRFINGDDAFRNSRFKLLNKIVRGPWIVKAATGNHSACLLGKALNCHYIRGPSYLEIDVDIGSSTVANAILHLALGYVTVVAVDLAFVIESQTQEELPERVLGAVRVAHMEMGAASTLEVPESNTDAGEKSPRASGDRSPRGGLQSQMSWRKLGRSISLFTGVGKAGKVDVKGEGQVTY